MISTPFHAKGMSPLLVFSVIFSVKLLDLNVFLVCVLVIFSFFSQMIVLSTFCPLAFFSSLLVWGLGFCCHVGGNYGSFRVLGFDICWILEEK
jgi:hypothetical protein